MSDPCPMHRQQQEAYFLSRKEQLKRLQYTINKEGRIPTETKQIFTAISVKNNTKDVPLERSWWLGRCWLWSLVQEYDSQQLQICRYQLNAVLRTSTKYKMMAHAPWQHGFDNSPNLTCLQVVRVRQLERPISIILNTSIWFVHETWKAKRPAKVAGLNYRSHWSGGALYI